MLFAAGEDGCLSVHEVRDVQAVGADREALPWAEEVLVTKSDLEERRRQAAELEQRLQDNQMGFEVRGCVGCGCACLTLAAPTRSALCACVAHCTHTHSAQSHRINTSPLSPPPSTRSA